MRESGAGGYAYLWKHRVRPGAEDRFERPYGRDGAWARLFARSPFDLGTELLRAREPGWYLTVDRWTSREAHHRFVVEHRAEWERLDALGEELTVTEERLGAFAPVDGRAGTCAAEPETTG